MLNKYNYEQYKEDCDWLRGELFTEEAEEFILNVVKKSFAMTKEDFIKFLNEVK